jgi:pyridine nucleotide-disulfide oxidoreductase family protein
LKHLVLIGGGHAHVHVLRDFAKLPLPAARVTLVSPAARLIYSGMVPGHVAGHYTLDESTIPLGPLAAAGKVEVIDAAATGVDAATRTVTLSNGETLRYDVLSLDTGGVIDPDAIPGARDHALFVRPMQPFVQRCAELVERAQAGAIGIVMVGGGAAGAELAMALQHRLKAQARVSLVTGGPPPMASYPAGVQARVKRALRERGITLFEDSVARIAAGHVLLGQHGGRLACDAAIVAIGVSAPPWLRDSGLSLDEQGFVATLPTLQSVSHAEVFAAGDIASRPDAPRPRSGVYAVRAGPPLALNLRRFVGGGALEPHAPQARSLNLLSCGERYAIASWGNWSAEGRWAWWWKDRIDRAFVRGFTGPAAGRR